MKTMMIITLFYKCHECVCDVSMYIYYIYCILYYIYITLVKQREPECIRVYCTIHHQALIVKTLPDELNSIINTIVSAAVLGTI